MAVGAPPKLRCAGPEPDGDGEQQPNDKPARVRPIGDAAAFGRGANAVKDLQPEPKRQHDPRGQREDADDDYKKDKDVDLRLWEEQQIAPHNARNSPRCADQWHGRCRGRQVMDIGRRHARQQVKDQEPNGSHLVFHVVAENPQKQHVARQMHKSTVQEHGGDEGGVCLPLVQAGGDQGVVKIELAQGTVVGERGKTVDIDQNVHRNQDVSDDGGPFGGVVIANWKHGRTIGMRAGGVKRDWPACVKLDRCAGCASFGV